MFDPMAMAPGVGATGNDLAHSGREAVEGEAGANPARGVRAVMPVQLGWRGEFPTGRPAGPAL